MKNLLQIIILILSSTLFGQDYYEVDLSREKPNFKNVVLKTRTLRDSTGITNYISNIQVYDKNGISILEFDLNRKGDTLEKITTSFPNKYSELQIHSYSNAKSDTAYYYYNKNNFEKKEIWKWGDNNETDTYEFFYDKNNRLLKQEVYFGVEKSWDTLIYKNDRITTVLSYDDTLERQDSISYLYNQKNHLAKILKFNLANELQETQTFKTNQKGKFKEIIKEFKTFEWSKDKRKHIIRMEYHPNGELKTKIVEEFINGKLESKSKLNFNESGLLEKIKVENLTKGITTEKKITLHNTV
ncbi:hypothetical protein [Algibacter luteus]|uniref:hypothetical protein n=1 Tax=Algibacter luteus TaxID=1178825 RepID=UPI0025947CA4|nr:hypothetical protein [Algibacter luteus]WJJ96575.1 hypothetical protein O5O44_15280 [Algibacter luteus]